MKEEGGTSQVKKGWRCPRWKEQPVWRPRGRESLACWEFRVKSAELLRGER